MATVKIEVDGSSAEREIKTLKKDFKSLDDQIAKTTKTTGLFSSSVQTLGKTLVGVGFGVTLASLAAITKALKYAAIGFTTLAGYAMYAMNKLDKFNGVTDRLGTQMTEAKASFDAFSTTLMKPVYDVAIAGFKEINRLTGEQAPKALAAMSDGIKTMAKIGIDSLSWLLKAIGDVITAIMKIPEYYAKAMGSLKSWGMEASNKLVEWGILNPAYYTASANAINETTQSIQDADAVISSLNSKNEAYAASIDTIATKLKTVVDESKPLDFAKMKADYLKMGAEEIKVAGKTAKKIATVKKAAAQKIVNVDKKIKDDAAKEDMKRAEEVADTIESVMSNAFNSLLRGDFQGAMEGVFDTLLNVVSNWAAKTIMELDAVSLKAAVTAIAQAAAETTWVGLAAMTAAMVGLGIAVSGSGSGGSASYAMPSYADVSGGGTEATGTTLNSEGAYMSMIDYNAVLKIAQYNQTDFNAALGEYNDLMSEAKGIWEGATDSLRKWGRELSSYDEALNATRSVGSFDSLNEFYDIVATGDEQIEYLSKTVSVLEEQSGLAGVAMEDLSGYIRYLVSQGDQLSMAQANRAAELGIAQHELNEAAAERVEEANDRARESAEAAAQAMDDMAQAIENMREQNFEMLSLVDTIYDQILSGINAFSLAFEALFNKIEHRTYTLNEAIVLANDVTLENYQAVLAQLDASRKQEEDDLNVWHKEVISELTEQKTFWAAMSTSFSTIEKGILGLYDLAKSDSVAYTAGKFFELQEDIVQKLSDGELLGTLANEFVAAGKDYADIMRSGAGSSAEAEFETLRIAALMKSTLGDEKPEDHLANIDMQVELTNEILQTELNNIQFKYEKGVLHIMETLQDEFSGWIDDTADFYAEYLGKDSVVVQGLLSLQNIIDQQWSEQQIVDIDRANTEDGIMNDIAAQAREISGQTNTLLGTNNHFLSSMEKHLEAQPVRDLAKELSDLTKEQKTILENALFKTLQTGDDTLYDISKDQVTWAKAVTMQICQSANAISMSVVASGNQVTQAVLGMTTSMNTYQTATPVAMAKGGIVTSPTNTLIGEAGYPEAVIPLKNSDDPLGNLKVAKLLEKMEKALTNIEGSNDKIRMSSSRQFTEQLETKQLIEERL